MSDTLIAPPTVPGWYTYVTSPANPAIYPANLMMFMLNRQGQWYAISGDLSEMTACAWGYIEQALSTFDLRLVAAFGAVQTNLVDAPRLSKMLFEARELVDMYGYIVEKYNGSDKYSRQVRDQIDLYRAERGWNPDGFGGETT